jgi:hypothetical protein
MMRNTFLAAVAAIIVSALAPTAAAQTTPCTANGAPASCFRTGTVSMTAGRVVLLQMNSASTALTTPTPADFDAGFNSTTGPILTVSANAAFTLSMRSGATFWTATNTSPGAPARTTKPAGDLKWSKVSTGPFNALTTADITLTTGAATASNVTTLYFQTLYDWLLDTPGNYSLPVVLTLTSP